MLTPEFAVRRFGARYDRAEVDAFVERILAAARTASPSLTVADLRNVGFRAPVFGAGYAADEVDAFIADAERWMPDRPVAGQVPTPVATGTQRPAPTFSMVRLQDGYDVEEVDIFVDRVMATVNGQPVDGPVTAREIQNVQFTPVRFREGYDVLEVDQFLEQAEGWLSGRR
ncbi:MULTISPECIES: DivIVA domain-containing protein [unclassified Kribbella]|uniref:DivIVA domain-containing protein n=1 Tax=unclassified Kribbella TaxID=2644121 RepID=UPI003018D69C